MFEEPAMFKPLSYSSEVVSIRQPLALLTDNESLKAKNIRAGSPDIFMSMGKTRTMFRKPGLEYPKTRFETIYGIWLYNN